MNKNDIIKWVLIAGAAYLVYRYLTAQTAAAPAATAGATPKEITAGAGAGTGSGAGTGAGASNTASTPTIAQALVAAATKLGYDPNADYNGYEWGYFWQRTPIYNGKDIGPTELGLSDTGKAPLSVAVAAVGKILSGVAGIDGLSRLQQAFGAYTPVSGWSM